MSTVRTNMVLVVRLPACPTVLPHLGEIKLVSVLTEEPIVLVVNMELTVNMTVTYLAEESLTSYFVRAIYIVVK